MSPVSVSVFTCGDDTFDHKLKGKVDFFLSNLTPINSIFYFFTLPQQKVKDNLCFSQGMSHF